MFPAGGEYLFPFHTHVLYYINVTEAISVTESFISRDNNRQNDVQTNLALFKFVK